MEIFLGITRIYCTEKSQWIEINSIIRSIIVGFAFFVFSKVQAKLHNCMIDSEICQNLLIFLKFQGTANYDRLYLVPKISGKIQKSFIKTKN